MGSWGNGGASSSLPLDLEFRSVLLLLRKAEKEARRGLFSLGLCVCGCARLRLRLLMDAALPMMLRAPSADGGGFGTL